MSLKNFTEPQDPGQSIKDLRQQIDRLMRENYDMRNLIWMLVASAGGEIDISYPMLQDGPTDKRVLTVEERPETRGVVYTARLK